MQVSKTALTLGFSGAKMKALEGFRLKSKKGGVPFQPRTNIDDTNFCHSLAMNDGENARLLLDKRFSYA